MYNFHYMEVNDVHIAVIQETKYTEKSKVKPFPNYKLFRKDRGNNNKGGGLAFLVEQGVQFQSVESPTILEDNDHLEELTIQIKSDNNTPLQIRNVYIPPSSSCTQGYTPPVEKLAEGLKDDFLILGDVNAHHHLW